MFRFHDKTVDTYLVYTTRFCDNRHLVVHSVNILESQNNVKSL